VFIRNTDLAITFEKHSVVFCTTMKKVVAKNLGQARLRAR